MRRTALGMIAATLLLLAVGGPAHAQITLRFSPADTTISPATSGRLTVMLDDAIDVRTIDLRVSFDPAIVSSVVGGGGALFTDSGYQLFQGFENSAPGEWYGYSVIIGAGLSVLGPGELFYWDFEAVAEGVSAVTSVNTYLAAEDGTWYPGVTLSQTTITVGDPTSSVGDLPALKQGLRLHPNPFNPRTEIFFDLPQPGYVELAVYDLRGREVVVLHQGLTPAGPFTSSWDGLDSRGLAQPGGVYLFRLATPAGQTGTKGVLLK